MIILLFSMALACTPAEKFINKCNDICKYENTEEWLGIVINNKCRCAEPPNSLIAPIKIKRKHGPEPEKKPTWRQYE